MLTSAMVAQLTPATAKLYLTLQALADHRYNPPLAHAPLKTLLRYTQVSRPTCLRGLAKLRQLNLIQTHRPNRRRPASYLLLAPAPEVSSPPAAHSEMIPRTAPTPSPVIPQTPAAAPKTPPAPPMRPQLTPPSGIMSATARSLNDQLLDPNLIRLLKAALAARQNSQPVPQELSP